MLRRRPDLPGSPAAPRPGRPEADPAQANLAVWRQGNFVSAYSSRSLRPPEVVVLLRYAGYLHGRVLELGCGAGRLTGYLGARGAEVLGVDISEEMIDHCRRHYPEIEFAVGDLRDLSEHGSASREAVIASFNVLGVFDDLERRRVLAEIARILSSDGLLYFSAHNRARLDRIPSPLALAVRARDPLRVLWGLARAPTRGRNRRRLLHLERHEETYSIANDEAHDYSLLHYYIGRDEQARQLETVGFELLECLDADGQTVAPGNTAPHSPELHYVARLTAK
jgi:SAM-dependent methyltransferase